MNTYIHLQCLRPLITNSILKNVKSPYLRQNLKPIFSTQVVWSSQLCSARPVQALKFDAPIKQYSTAAPTEVSSYKSHQHSTLWKAERAITLVSLIAIVDTFYDPCENLECFTSFIIALHAHWGLEATLTDYIRPAVFGKTIPKFVQLYAASISGLVLVLLLWCAIYGNGIVRTVQQFWYLDLSINPYAD